MTIDYSKWDKLTLSDDDEEEGQQPQNANATKNCTFRATAGFVGRRQCSYCEKLMPDRDAKICSRCKFQVYCSLECQRSHWKQHKTTCTKRDTSNAEIENVHKKLVRQLEWYSDKPIFRFGDGKTIDKKPKSLSEVAQRYFQSQGKGVVVLYFEDSNKVIAATNLIKTLVKNPYNKGWVVVPEITYQPWPDTIYGEPYPPYGLVATLMQANLRSIFEKMPLNECFVCAVQMRQPQPPLTSMHTLRYNPRTHISGSGPVPIRSLNYANQFIQDLEGSEAFRKCRMFLIEHYHKPIPGAVWLPNLLGNDDNPIWTPRGMKNVEPKELLKALKRNLQQKRPGASDSFCNNVVFCPLQFPCFRSEVWMPWLVGKHELMREVSSPNILVCALMWSPDAHKEEKKEVEMFTHPIVIRIN